MKVYIRHEDESDSERVVAEVSHPKEIEGVLDALTRSGGVYYNGDTRNDLSYQIVMNEQEVFGEIIIHDAVQP